MGETLGPLNSLPTTHRWPIEPCIGTWQCTQPRQWRC